MPETSMRHAEKATSHYTRSVVIDGAFVRLQLLDGLRTFLMPFAETLEFAKYILASVFAFLRPVVPLANMAFSLISVVAVIYVTIGQFTFIRTVFGGMDDVERIGSYAFIYVFVRHIYETGRALSIFLRRRISKSRATH